MFSPVRKLLVAPANLKQILFDMNSLRKFHELLPSDMLATRMKERLLSLDISGKELQRDKSSCYCLLQCLSYFKLYDAPAVNAAVKASEELLPGLRGSDFANLLSVFAEFEPISGEMMEFTRGCVDSMDAHGLVAIVRVLARRHVMDGPLWKRVSVELIKKINDFSTQQLMLIVQSAAVCEIIDENLFCVIERRVVERIMEFQPSQITHIIQGFQKISMPTTRLMTEMHAREPDGQVETKDIASVLSKMGHGAEDSSQKMTKQILSDVKTATMAQMVSCLHRCWQYQIIADDVSEAILQRVEQLSPEWSVVGVANILPRMLRLGLMDANHPLLHQLLDCLSSHIEELELVVVLQLAVVLQIKNLDRCAIQQEIYQALSPTQKLRSLNINHYLNFLKLVTEVEQFRPLLQQPVHEELIAAKLESIPTRHIPVVFAALGSMSSYSNGTRERMNVLLRKLLKVERWAAMFPPKELLSLLTSMQLVDISDLKNEVCSSISSVVLLSTTAFTCEQLRAIMITLAQLQWRNEEFYMKAGLRVLDIKPSTSPNVISVLYTLALLQSRKGEVVKLIAQCTPRMHLIIPSAGHKDITRLMYALVKLQLSTSDLLTIICERIMDVAEAFSHAEISSLVSSLRAMNALGKQRECMQMLTARMQTCTDVGSLTSFLLNVGSEPAAMKEVPVSVLLQFEDSLRQCPLHTLPALTLPKAMIILAKYERSSSIKLCEELMKELIAKIDEIHLVAIVHSAWAHYQLTRKELPENHELKIKIKDNLSSVVHDRAMRDLLKEAHLFDLVENCQLEKVAPLPWQNKLRPLK